MFTCKKCGGEIPLYETVTMVDGYAYHMKCSHQEPRNLAQPDSVKPLLCDVLAEIDKEYNTESEDIFYAEAVKRVLSKYFA